MVSASRPKGSSGRSLPMRTANSGIRCCRQRVRKLTAPGMQRKENREKSSVLNENRSILRESASVLPFSFSYCTVAPDREYGMSVGTTSRTVLTRPQSASGRVGVRQ